MKRLLLTFALLTGCATSGASVKPLPDCVATLAHATAQDVATRIGAVLASGASRDVIAANLEDIARDVGPDAFNCALEYVRSRL